jgi:hypothetical protein
MSLMDIFRSAPAQAPAAQQSAPASSPSGTPTGGGTPANGSPAPSNGVPSSASAAPASPLDAFSKMFDNNTDNQDTAPIFALDQDMVQKAATGLDFLSKVDQTIMQRIQDVIDINEGRKPETPIENNQTDNEIGVI